MNTLSIRRIPAGSGAAQGKYHAGRSLRVPAGRNQSVFVSLSICPVA
ncbi:hypothetical protein ACFTAO_44670 [Paenibacillus rhizoplanae]